MLHLKRQRTISRLANYGFAILPLAPKGKKPVKSGGVHAASNDKNALRKTFEANPRYNYGIATGAPSGIMVLDIDGPDGRKSLKALKREHGPLPRTVRVNTARGFHLYFGVGDKRIGNSAGKLGKGIDVRGDGGYVVGPYSRHESGCVYTFAESRSFDEIDVAPAPDWLVSIAEKKTPPKAGNDGSLAEMINPSRSAGYAAAALERELTRLAKAPMHQRNNTLNTCAFKLGQFVGSNLLDESVVRSRLASVASGIGLADAEISGTVESGIRAGRSSPRSFAQLSEVDPKLVEKDALALELSTLGETDTDNAERFARRFADRVAWCPEVGWLAYDGRRWAPDATPTCIERAKSAARLIASEIEYLTESERKTARGNFSKMSLSKSALERMLDLSKGLLTIEHSWFDSDPYVLNCLSGTIDLHTGELSEHDPRDYLTKLAPVDYRPDAECPQFKMFLNQITARQRSLKGYLRRAIGYSLTGSTREQVFFFCYGPSGSNGKSTLLNLIRDMLGDYGRHTPTETLMVKQYDNSIPNDLARLAGVRMVTAVETNAGKQLDEARVKAITGGEKVTARFMRAEYFEYVPQFKLWFGANDRPRVRGTDTAMWRRIRVVPFNVQIPESDRDDTLPEKLREEYPGILAWAVRGCVAWQQKGLSEPEAVSRATTQWYQAADHVKRFLGDEIIADFDSITASASLFDRYGEWCRRNGETPLDQKKLNSRLQDGHDLTLTRSRRGSDWKGIKLRLR